MVKTCGPDGQVPSLDKDRKEGTDEDERSEIFSSLQEEESSLMEDWTNLTED